MTRDPKSSHGVESGEPRKQPFMPLKGRLYLLSVIVPAAAVLTYSLYQVLFLGSDLRWLWLGALTLVASSFRLRVPLGKGGRGSISITVSDCFIFSAFLLLGPEAAVVIAALEGLANNIRCGVKRVHQFVFNVAQVVVTSFLVASLFYRVHGGAAPLDSGLLAHPAVWLEVLSLALLYFLLNTVLVVAAVATTSRQSGFSLWKNHLLKFFPTNLLNASAALVVFLCFSSLNFTVALAFFFLGLSLCYARQSLLEAGMPLSFGARLYVGTLVVSGLLISSVCLFQVLQAPSWRWLFLAALTAAASLYSVYIPGSKGKNQGVVITFSNVFVLSAILVCGPVGATALSTLEGLISTWKSRRSVKGLAKVFFDLTLLPLLTFLVASLFQLVHPAAVSAGPAVLLTLGLCSLLYFGINAGAVSLAMFLATGRSLRNMLRKSLPSALLRKTVETLAAFVVVVNLQQTSLLRLSIILLALAAFYLTHRIYLMRLQSAQQV
ncbi:MAG: hypothetical protein ACE5JX_21250 [Acidobacteriota bacterium]